jgi:hypothetical protein
MGEDARSQERRRDEALRRALAMPPLHHRAQTESAGVRLSASASELLSLVELGERALESLDPGISLPEFPEKLVSVKMDVPLASGAREVRVRLDPSDGLRGFVAALWTRDVDLGAVKSSFGHTGNSSLNSQDRKQQGRPERPSKVRKAGM